MERTMLNISEEFLKPETREDFYVDKTMKSYWACLLDLVNVIDEICRRHSIQYFIDWGTMLGAARHQGFIPWDDDIDLAMKRPDYERLIPILQKELPEGYVVSNVFINDTHKSFFTGISTGSAIDFSKKHLEDYYGCPFVATIDIFPLDYVPRDPQVEIVVRELFTIIWQGADLIKKGAPAEEIERAVQDAEAYSGVKIDRSKNIRAELWKLATNLAKSFGEEDGDYLTQWCTYVNSKARGLDLLYKKEWYDETILLPFENLMLPAPKYYDEIMWVMFGDWHKRVKNTQSHEYPCFKDQIEFMKQKIQEMKEEAGEARLNE